MSPSARKRETLIVISGARSDMVEMRASEQNQRRMIMLFMFSPFYIRQSPMRMKRQVKKPMFVKSSVFL